VIFQRLAGQRGLIRSSAVVFAGNSTARLLGFLFSVVAARVLGTQDFGRFAFGLTVASIAAILVTNAPRGLSRFLAREDAHRLTIVGAGVQGRAHAESMRAVRPVDDIVVISRTRSSAAALADDLREDGVPARVGGPEDLADADLICTCTTNRTPVVEGAVLAEGVHVNAVGAYTPTMRELDTAAIVRSRLVVETRPAAMEEAGDLLIAIGEGAVQATHVVADLHELVNGARVRRDARDVTVFKSVGIAFEDLVLSRAAVAAG